MHLFRIRLELSSPIGTPLRADTLWGHIAWGIRYHEGEDALTAWLDRYDGDTPPLIISDPLPTGFLPLPHLARKRSHTLLSRDEHRRLKKQGKKEWLPIDQWPSLSRHLSYSMLNEVLSRADQPVSPTKAAVMHAAINRLTSGTEQEDGGTLFSNMQHFYHHEKMMFDIFAWSDYDKDETASFFKHGLSGGYGRDASSGMGNLRLTEITSYEFTLPDNADACMTLASTTPSAQDAKLISGTLETRAGRLGGTFAIEPTPDGTDQRQKRPVTGFTTGSVFRYKPGTRWVGRVLAEVHTYAPIRHYAMAPVFPCKLAENMTLGVAS